MKKILLVSNGYPTQENLYSNSFIHRRVKSYLETGKYEVDVIVFTNSKEKEELFDGIKIIFMKKTKYIDYLEKSKYDLYFIHFAKKEYTKPLLDIKNNEKIIVWVHGYEALSWKRRLFILRFDVKSILFFIGYLVKNIIQMRFIKKMIRLSNKNKKISFIFVSEWMKNTTEKDSKMTNEINDFSIIPNVIDEDIFKYIEREKREKLKIISIRPYHSRKYANDISVEVILELSKKEYFEDLEFEIYGKGRLFNKTTRKLRGFKNIIIKETFFDQEELSLKYKNSDVLLIPTRQDAQGVSMCEGMASGLVPITSNNTAIPEFVNKESGYLCNSIREMVEAIEELYNDKNILFEKSIEASRSILNKCSKENVIKKELYLFEEVLRDD